MLKTLKTREIKAGYAEVLKYGLLGDVDFFNWLDENGADVLRLKPEALTHAVSVSCQTKARIVAADELERGQRALLNLGHSFGHALELEADYSGDLLHGEAVSAGMLMAFEFSAAQGLCPQADVTRLNRHLGAHALTRPSDLPKLIGVPERLISHMDQDKKNEGGTLTLILARKIGESFVKKQAPRADVHAYLTHLAKTLPNV